MDTDSRAQREDNVKMVERHLQTTLEATKLGKGHGTDSPSQPWEGASLADPDLERPSSRTVRQQISIVILPSLFGEKRNLHEYGKTEMH